MFKQNENLRGPQAGRRIFINQLLTRIASYLGVLFFLLFSFLRSLRQRLM